MEGAESSGKGSSPSSKRLLRTARRGSGRLSSGSHLHEASANPDPTDDDGSLDMQQDGGFGGASLIPSFLMPATAAAEAAEADGDAAEQRAGTPTADLEADKGAGASELPAEPGGALAEADAEDSPAAATEAAAAQAPALAADGVAADAGQEPAEEQEPEQAAQPSAGMGEEVPPASAIEEGQVALASSPEAAQVAAGDGGGMQGHTLPQQQAAEAPQASGDTEMADSQPSEAEEEMAVATAVAACSRANLKLVLVNRVELIQLVRVEQSIRDWCDANTTIEPVPSVLSGLVVRFYASKAYHMSRVVGMQLDSTGKVEVQLQDRCIPQIPLMGVSNRNMLAEDKAWEEQGRLEAAELQAAMQATGGLWGPEQLATTAWRRKLALAWLAFVSAIDGDIQQELPALLGRLDEESSIDTLLAKLELEGGLAAGNLAAPPQPAGQQQQHGAKQQRKTVGAGRAAATGPAGGAAAGAAAAAAAGTGMQKQLGEPGMARPQAGQGATWQELLAGDMSLTDTPEAAKLLPAAAPHLPSASGASMSAALGGTKQPAPTPEVLRALLATLPSAADNAAATPQEQVSFSLPPALQQMVDESAPLFQGSLVAPAANIAGPPGQQQQQQQQQQAGSALETLQQVLLLVKQGASAGSQPGQPRGSSGPPSSVPGIPGFLPRATAAPAQPKEAGAAPHRANTAGKSPARAAERAGTTAPEQQRQVRTAAAAGAAAAAAGGVKGAQQQQGRPEKREGVGKQQQQQSERQRERSSEQEQEGTEAALKRRRRPITWQPQESAPGDRPLEVSKPVAPAAKPLNGAAGGLSKQLSNATGALSKQSSGVPVPAAEPAPKLVITRTFDAGPGPSTKKMIKQEDVAAERGPVVHVDATRLQAPSPLGPAQLKPSPAPERRTAVREMDGNLTFVVRNMGDKGGSQAQLGFDLPHGGAAELAAAAPMQQQAALLQQLAQALAAGGGTGGVAGIPPEQLLQMPAHVLLSQFGAQLLQQQLAPDQLGLAALQQQLGTPLSPTLTRRSALAGEALPSEGLGASERGPAASARGERSPDVLVGVSASEQSGRGKDRQVLLDSEDKFKPADVSVEVKGVKDLEGARRYLERLTRVVVPSKERNSAVQRACLRELLQRGLSAERGRPGVFRQSGVVVAMVGQLMLDACKASKEVAAQYEQGERAGRVLRLSQALERQGLVEKVETKQGRREILLRVDRLERLAAAAEGGSRSAGAKRPRSASEQEVAPAPKLARAADPQPMRDGGGGRGSSPRRHAPIDAPPAAGPLPPVSAYPPSELRNSMSYANFWDPVWNYENGMVRFLRKQPGRVAVGTLFNAFPLPAIFPDKSWDAFQAFLRQRPTLFDLSPEGVGAVKGASALLHYKRDLLQYLGTANATGCRALMEDVMRNVALPADTTPHVVNEARHNFWSFLTKYYSKDVWLVAPKHYTPQRPIKTVEIRPFFDPHPDVTAPRIRGVCRFFEANRPGSCSKQEQCNFAHCTERPLF